MSAHEDLVTRINNQYPHMSKGQKRIAEYILHDYDKAAFMTALKLAEKAGVSESTVVRFAMAIDFDGYPALQRALQEMVQQPADHPTAHGALQRHEPFHGACARCSRPT